MTDIPAVDLPGGVAMPMLGFGTWQIQGETAHQAVSHALAAGYRHIDTATMYGNEEQVGRALAGAGVSRDEVFLTTKLPPGSAGRARAVLEESLRALRIDHVDLWLIHWPPRRGKTTTSLWGDFLAARDAGLARAVGVSNFSVRDIDDIAKATGERPAVNQIPWSPPQYDQALLAAHAERGIAVEGYSALKKTNLCAPVLAEIAAAHQVTPVQVVLRWHIDTGVIAIPKSTHPDRIDENLDLFGFSLTPDEITRINNL